MQDSIRIFDWKNISFKATELPNTILCDGREFKLVFSNGVLATYAQQGKFSREVWKNVPVK